jgi:1-piperideine-2-carboxylate/1-pyrroline-2-carboxylate reductase [NAD(P)H]
VRFFTAEETGARLPYVDLAESIRKMALERASGEVRAPARMSLSLPEGGVLLVMPAADGAFAITKLVTVHPRNPERDLPTIEGEVVVMEAATGRRLGILDGSALTARRTAALSLLAARELAPHPEGPLLIVGAGTQGRAHLEAFREGLGIARVFITSRTAKRAASLGKHAEDLGVEARVIEDPKEILDEVSLVVTATTSREPVLPGEVPDGIFVAAVGSFEPEAAELPAELVSRSSVVVDTLEGAREEAGDLIQAERFGAFEWNSATSLEDALRASVRPKGTVVFKSVGHALWDLAAARTVFSGRSRG